MGTIIAVNGKGGTGKSTISALIVRQLSAVKNGSVLAIDADPNSCLADYLGVRGVSSIVDICDEISGKSNKIPSGMTKDRYIEMRVQEAVAEANGFDLVAMGRPEGPGCYCYVNNLLRGVIERLTSSYDLIVIDNAAGMEHISRRTMAVMNKLVLVSDYSVVGVNSAGKIYDLAKKMGIKIGAAYLVVNKVTGAIDRLKPEIKKIGLEVAGEIPEYKDLESWSLSGKSIFEFDNAELSGKVKDICERLTVPLKQR